MRRISHIVLSWLLFGWASLAGAEEPSPRFYRAINLNGPAIVIGGQQWEAGDAATVKGDAKAFTNLTVPLVPKTDPDREAMIRSSRWGNTIEVELREVPSAVYQVFLYVWEDNDSETYSISVNGKLVVADFRSGTAGQWKRLGPWRTTVRNGTLTVSAQGGAANLSGLEVWSGDGPVPDPRVAEFAASPTEDQLQFFESRIRPLLVDHCYECHSQESDEVGGGLLLDSRAGVIRGGTSKQTIVPGNPEISLLMTAVSHTNPDLKMPPDAKLSEEQIADLATWIRMKAPDPRLDDTVAVVKARSEIDWNQAREFWSLQPLSQTPPPAVQDASWPANPIDHFVLSKLESSKLTPAVDADRRTLIRRATFDLIGLPPSPEEVAAFLADTSHDAFAKVIDRLLESPQYGERWGRHWMDVVRYADTAGDNSDFPIPQAYLYRNWVIDAFNRDLPYDEFVREQLAGDLMGGASAEERRSRIIATGYIASARRFGSRVDDYPQHLTIEDTIDNVGRTFLAMTINCARCHNHKFDPITSEDYYAIYGIFHSTRYPWPGIELDQRQRNFVALAPPDEVERVENERRARKKELDEKVKRLKQQRDKSQGDEQPTLTAALKKAEEAVREFSRQPLPYETIYAVAESPSIEDVPVQIKGDPTKPGDVVPRRFLKVLSGQTLPDGDQTSGRLQLANWIVDRSNPLTARVMVNRIWQYHFGQALVKTANDFGRHGQPPSHPDLLDWLAQRFINSGWSIKSLHRTIMLSRTYRQSSRLSAAALQVDPVNQLLSAYPRHRLDAEAIRDTLLLLGGNLDPTPGEAHPFPPQDQWKFTQHNPFKAIYESNRRSVYLMTQRIQRHPYLAIFDGADPATSVPSRLTSTTPLQALYLLNDKFVHEQANGLARQLLSEAPDDTARIKRVWSRMFSRPPEPDESAAARQLLADVRRELETAGGEGDELAQQSWEALVRSLMRLNELVYVE